MTVRPLTVWVVTCNGCGRELGQDYGHRETYDSATEAGAAALHAGWTRHPDGSYYCESGAHQ